MSRFDPPVLRVAALGGLLALGLMLSACGRAGPLEPPPGTLVGPEGVMMEAGPDGKPVAVPGQKRRLPIDVLLD